MLKNPATKYHSFKPINLTDRQWPSRVITRAPIWMSTDLRDGNQALFEPMNAQRKMRMFKTLVQIGFKEIEVAFPSASQTDFNFVRELIEGGHIPDDVTIEVLTQARDDLIERTFESLRGAPRAIVHLYNATAPEFRRIVFGLEKSGVKELAQNAARTMKRLADATPETHFTLQYSPEVFSGTELEFAKEVCDAVFDIWQPTPEHKAIVNLPATVEMATPNVYADQIEWMHRNLARRDSLIVSVHPHNDRGTAVAAAELAVMAGADRVEGCLFGNGERTGNVDLVTLALNLYTQGVDPELDFSNINEVARTAEECTQLPVHPRHPYVGDLVFTAFSGSHQDAIKKGFAVQKPDAVWEVPYMPIDPSDLGRTYDSVIRVNSQSGKGGIAYLLEQGYGVVLPRRLQVDFSSAVQRYTDDSGQEVTPSQIWELFQQEYVHSVEPIRYIGHSLSERGDREHIKLTVDIHGSRRVLSGEGNGPLDALMHAMGVPVRIQHYEERALTQGADARAVAVAEMAGADVAGSAFGVGIDANLVTASIRAVISGVNRAYERASSGAQERFFEVALRDDAERVAV
ncbi:MULTISPECIES: 2-isopropylmalate synthase [Paraburkholderia]|uniref:2-isopropylmalate synthase n=1 Tax=Paraburkholderia aspalathi TaxID=1324617 RepID=A0A1I7EK50_9BURK|nr:MULTISPECIES: 2-isopropylmalate synthase [Paraburkholderia]MCP2084949.1 2-isopropylmalate synthase [Paraburkholderia sediminicola]MBK3823336.1 2-isopropylmalate synthase [Paraburkholderia aspalathi]MBK3835175.1 2-isopropylmalate synthase [Paraburkholderia aspalathi]MBK3864888.1 2-isopropylmalate synthase [Paraburkholderia aspalathi]MCX4157798.1 2-isopropylmalate synthase [Paraburkholderia aspalathi]